MPEVQAEPVEAARWGWSVGSQDLLRDKAFKSQVGIAGVSPITGWPVERYRIGAGL